MNRVMEPRIQYAKTRDGVSIAYAVFGEGTPLVYTGGSGGVHFYSHLAISRRSVDQLTAAGLQVIRYDGRGTGSSDRNIRDFSLETELLDLEAVVERLGLERFALLGRLGGAPAAIAYAARRPECVSHLVLRDPWASAADVQSLPVQGVRRAMRALAEEQWELISLNIAYLIIGFNDDETVKEYAAALRSELTAATWVARGEASDEIDVTRLLGAVSAPTLVVLDTTLPGRTPADEAVWGGAAKKIAASIPDARVVTTDDFAAAVSEFVRAGAAPKAPQAVLPQGTAIILFADIADSAALTERLGDAAFRENAREMDSALRAIIRKRAGTAIEGKLLGDGVLAVFTSARQAIEAALACGRSGNDTGLPLHLGLHAGDVIREDNNVYGGAVDITSRISGLSAAPARLVSWTARSVRRTSAEVWPLDL